MILLPRYTYIDSYFDSEGLQINPVANTVLADTGQLDKGLYNITILLATNTTTIYQFDLQHRNADNTANIFNTKFWWRVTMKHTVFNFELYQLSQGERFRVINDTNIAGKVQAVVYWVKRYE